MYKLIIADDEETIREGLRDIVDWPGMGFQIAAVFPDGQDVLAYLEKESVDVILTDIRMTFVGGLEIAGHISRSGLPVKVILISGYQEVELAMSAIRYHVSDYILKPINLQDLAAAFGRVKNALDEERQNRLYEETLAHIQQDIREVKDDFISELLLGTLKPGRYIDSMLRLLYPGTDTTGITWFTTTLSISNYGSLPGLRMTSNEFYRSLRNCIGMASQEVEYHLRAKSGESILLMGLILQQPGDGEAEQIAEANRQLSQDLREIFGMECVFSAPVIGRGMECLAAGGSLAAVSAAGESGDCPIDIREQQKMLYSTLCTGNQEAVENILGSFLENLRTLPHPGEVVDSLFTGFRERLEEQGVDLSGSLLLSAAPLLSAEDLDPAERERGIRDAVLEITGRMRSLLPQEGDMIEQAKRYIQEHIGEDVSLETIADHFYMSQYYFSRVFKSRTGENLIDFIIRSKMEYAIRLLRQERWKVYQISHMTGYKSVRYFTKRFKGYTGYTPNVYRRLFLQGNQEEPL